MVGFGFAQESNRNQVSTAPDSVQYELIQSELGARYTFKVDKFNGYIFQLVQGEEDLTWQKIELVDIFQDKDSLDRVNYQLFVSGLGARYIFLLNVNTGMTWQLTEDLDSGELFWNWIL